MDQLKRKLIGRPLLKQISYEEKGKNSSIGIGAFENGSSDIKGLINSLSKCAS